MLSSIGLCFLFVVGLGAALAVLAAKAAMKNPAAATAVGQAAATQAISVLGKLVK